MDIPKTKEHLQVLEFLPTRKHQEYPKRTLDVFHIVQTMHLYRKKKQITKKDYLINRKTIPVFSLVLYT